MTLDEIIEFCSDEDNLQFTFDFSVFWMLKEVPNFIVMIYEAVCKWDLDVDKYLNGDSIAVEFEDECFSVSIKFDTNSKTFIINN